MAMPWTHDSDIGLPRCILSESSNRAAPPTPQLVIETTFLELLGGSAESLVARPNGNAFAM